MTQWFLALYWRHPKIQVSQNHQLSSVLISLENILASKRGIKPFSDGQAAMRTTGARTRFSDPIKLTRGL
jgi:hypothetical protein